MNQANMHDEISNEFPQWTHFPHEADMGIRGRGLTKEQAFEGGALALMAVITDLSLIHPTRSISVTCQSPDDELLFVDWLNLLVYEMSTRKMLFSRFAVQIKDHVLSATAWGEPIEVARHQPAVEVKGATYTELSVKCDDQGLWVAQCVVDV